MAREKLCVGIDIGASSVKLCQLKASKKGYLLEQFGMVPLPPEAIVDGALMNSARVIEAVQELVATHKVKNKQVAIAVSGHAVIIKKISLPQQTREELDESIQWEAEQFIPFDMADVNIDCQIVREQSAQHGQMEVVLVAAKKDLVNEYQSVIAEAGLEPTVCDVDAFAVENMFEINYDLPAEGAIALVNVGAAKTNINIIANGVSSFTRDLTIGGNAVTEEIQKAMGISFEEAEALKVGATKDEARDTDTVVSIDVERAIQAVAQNITSEVQRTIDFYSATASPTELYLSGGTARLRALSKCLEERLGIKITVADPFRNIQIQGQDRDYLRNIAPSAGVAVGLALRFAGDT